VGPHPDAEGLFLAVGDNGFGFMRSWAIGAVLAHTMVDGVLPVPVPRDVVRRFDPARFWPEPPAAFPVVEGYSLPPET
jgi:glycine/D-amino acid oxidase-like deaminating enzyme